MTRRSTIINRRPLRLYFGYCEIGVPPRLSWQYAGLRGELPPQLRCRKSWTPQPWMLDAAESRCAGKTLREIGQENGRTAERVRQILKRMGVSKMERMSWAEREKEGRERRKQIANYRKQQRFLLRVKAERLYLSGMSMQRVAAEMGLKCVMNVQLLMGPAVKRRPVGYWMREHQEELRRAWIAKYTKEERSEFGRKAAKARWRRSAKKSS